MVTVRQAVLDDADAIGSIWLEAFRVGYRGILPDEAIARRTDEAAETYWRTVLADPERASFVVVAEAPGDGIVGFAQAGPVSLRSQATIMSSGSSTFARHTTGATSAAC